MIEKFAVHSYSGGAAPSNEAVPGSIRHAADVGKGWSWTPSAMKNISFERCVLLPHQRDRWISSARCLTKKLAKEPCRIPCLQNQRRKAHVEWRRCTLLGRVLWMTFLLTLLPVLDYSQDEIGIFPAGANSPFSQCTLEGFA